MRALVQDRYGSPGVLRQRRVPVPTPGPGQIRAMVTLAGNLQTPQRGLAACVSEVQEGATLPETSACVLDKSLDLGRILRPPHAGGIQ